MPRLTGAPSRGLYAAMTATTQIGHTIDRLSSRPDGWRRSEWATGAFETASRKRTAAVDGSILPARHLVMATLHGGARRHCFRNADGQRFDGPDVAGAASFLPAGCERRLHLQDVEWRWAALALAPDAVDGADLLGTIGSFAVGSDPFILGMLTEMARLDALMSGLEPIYAETMAHALKHYLSMRFAGRPSASPKAHALPAWKLRRITEHVEAHLAERLDVASLARLSGLSERQFHRVFRVTTGQTPLAFVIARRIERARLLLVTTDESITSIALNTGFANPTHLARAFVAATGIKPLSYRLSGRVS